MNDFLPVTFWSMGFVSSHPWSMFGEIASLFFQNPCFYFHNNDIWLRLFICLNSLLSIDETKWTFLIFQNIYNHSKREHMLIFHVAAIPLNRVIEYILLHCLCVIFFLIFTGKNMRKECFPCDCCKQLVFSSYSFIKAILVGGTTYCNIISMQLLNR